MEPEILELLRALTAIDSVNPDLAPGGAGERRVAEYVHEWALAAGLEAELADVEPGRPNVVVRAAGTGGGASLMLNAHTDVVGVEGYPDPFTPVVEPDRIRGRGVLDTKVGLATALVHARRARQIGLRGDVIVAAVADEECGSKGTEALVASGRWRTDAAIVLEPTELLIVHAHRGWCWGRITVHGRAAHGSRPDLGVDAIAHCAPVLAGIGELQRRLSARSHPVVGPPSVHASIIRGGAEMPTYPARVDLDLERRLLPGESAADFAAELEELAGLVAAPATAEASVGFQRDALSVDPAEEIVRALQAAGPELSVGASAFWTDAALLAGSGIPSVVFGPGGGGIHETDEWLDLASFDVFERVLWSTVQSFCR